jgi:S-DNA-T family DNA segregation ATPase FtsK/SpoIIIE
MAFADRRLFAPTPASAPITTPPAGRFAAGRATVPQPEPVPRDRVRDLTALALLAACVFLVASLASFDPADPPAARTFPPHARAANACGQIGSAVASALNGCFGLGGWFVVGLVAGLDWMLLRRRPLSDLPLRAGGAVVATVGVCTLLSMFLPDWVGRPIWGPGGYCGAVGRLFAERHFARAGAAIVVSSLTLAGLFVACDALLLRLAATCAAACAAVAAGLRGIGALLSRLTGPRTGGGVDAAEDVAASRFPGLRLRNAAGGAADDADDADDDGQDSEPTIRVRRRERPMPEPAAFDLDDEESDEDADEESSAADSLDEEQDEEDAAPRPVVPIRSLSNRRPAALLAEPAAAPADYELPSLELLQPAEQLELEAQEQEVRERARVLEKTFGDFGFKVRVVEIETGPVISQYEIELEAGLRLAKIANLADDLAIALRVPSVRIVAPIPGKNSVGIEVPNTERQMVRLREVIEETQSKSRTMKIPIYLGKDVAGNPMVVDMASMPHLLIAGRTGTGKSVCLNSIIVSMLMSRRPDEVRMLMIDPKMVELTPYKSLPHLMHPVVTDMRKAEAILAWAVDKMEERYSMLAKAGVRHLSQYNQLGREELLRRMKPESDEEAAAIPTTMPFIVMIADEIADMMMTAGKEIEQHIIRLAQKSRAVGIHLVLATQKPTVDVITGLIKSNLPARIAFQVASRTDSRVVLDECGADRLLGNGDMLFLSPGTSTIMRGQGTYVSDEEIGRVMAAIGTAEPQYAAELVNLKPAASGDAPKGASPKDRDELYEAAVEVVIREGRGSVSLLQRALGVGYGRGARLIDFMAEDGVVGQYAGSQAREVLITMEQWAERNGTTAPAPDPAPRRLKIQPHAAVAAEEDEVDEDADSDADADGDAFAEEDDFDAEADGFDAGDDADEDGDDEDADAEDDYEASRID